MTYNVFGGTLNLILNPIQHTDYLVSSKVAFHEPLAAILSGKLFGGSVIDDQCCRCVCNSLPFSLRDGSLTVRVRTETENFYLFGQRSTPPGAIMAILLFLRLLTPITNSLT